MYSTAPSHLTTEHGSTEPYRSRRTRTSDLRHGVDFFSDCNTLLDAVIIDQQRDGGKRHFWAMNGFDRADAVAPLRAHKLRARAPSSINDIDNHSSSTAADRKQVE